MSRKEIISAGTFVAVMGILIGTLAFGIFKVSMKSEISEIKKTAEFTSFVNSSFNEVAIDSLELRAETIDSLLQENIKITNTLDTLVGRLIMFANAQNDWNREHDN
jgi:hypothetical protein